MKKIIFAIVFSFFVLTGFTQQVSKITLATNGDLETISVAVDDNVIVNLTDKGTISKFGLEPYNLRTENYGDYTDRLDPYNGRIEYYSPNDNPAFSGKVKYIGKTQITYYASYDDKAFSGRIKSIGNVSFTYYSSFDRPEYRGGRKTGQQLQYINGIKFYTK